MITLVFYEEREPIWRLLLQTLLEEQGIELTQEKGQAFYCRGDLDAVVLTGWVAHERFGGRPKFGEAQVLSTHDRPSRIVAPWAVAIPSFPGHPVFAGNERLDIVPDDPRHLLFACGPRYGWQ
jgi:hypothetical protein